MGCRLCEVQCQVAHTKYKDTVKAFKKSADRPIPGLRVESNGAVCFSLSCRHCDDPQCAYACITGALRKDPESGVVTYDAEKCAGCWTCLLACPYGIIKQDRQAGKIVKCDLCAGKDVPVCVSTCPNEALVLLSVEDSPKQLQRTG